LKARRAVRQRNCILRPSKGQPGEPEACPGQRQQLMERRMDNNPRRRCVKGNSFGEREGVRIGLVRQAYITRYAVMRSDEGGENKRA